MNFGSLFGAVKQKLFFTVKSLKNRGPYIRKSNMRFFLFSLAIIGLLITYQNCSGISVTPVVTDVNCDPNCDIDPGPANDPGVTDGGTPGGSQPPGGGGLGPTPSYVCGTGASEWAQSLSGFPVGPERIAEIQRRNEIKNQELSQLMQELGLSSQTESIANEFGTLSFYVQKYNQLVAAQKTSESFSEFIHNLLIFGANYEGNLFHSIQCQ